MVVIRSRPYLMALVLAAILGIPISAIAYGFLALVSKVQTYLFDDLPQDLFNGQAPAWWPIPFVALCGLVVGLDHSPPAGQRRSLAGLRLPRRRAAGRPSCPESSSLRWQRSAWGRCWAPRRR